jgi:hypothetical protein
MSGCGCSREVDLVLAGSSAGPEGWEEHGPEAYGWDGRGDRGMMGVGREGHFQGVQGPWLIQVVGIYVEGWRRPRCGGLPSTWFQSVITDYFRVRNGSTLPRAGDTAIDYTEHSRNVKRTGANPWSSTSPAGPGDKQYVAWSRRVCDLCMWRVYIDVRWMDGCQVPEGVIAEDVNYICGDYWEACYGCLCALGRHARVKGRISPDDMMHSSDAVKEVEEMAALNADLEGSVCSGPWRSDGIFAVGDICPCTDTPAPPPIRPVPPTSPPPPPPPPVTPAPPPPPFGPVTELPKPVRPVTHDAPRRLRVWRGSPNGPYLGRSFPVDPESTPPVELRPGTPDPNIPHPWGPPIPFNPVVTSGVGVFALPSSFPLGQSILYQTPAGGLGAGFSKEWVPGRIAPSSEAIGRPWRASGRVPLWLRLGQPGRPVSPRASDGSPIPNGKSSASEQPSRSTLRARNRSSAPGSGLSVWRNGADFGQFPPRQ